MNDTDCRKCKAPMPPPTPIKGRFAGMTMKVTAYRCESCGHWNNLKTRKPKGAADAQWLASTADVSDVQAAQSVLTGRAPDEIRGDVAKLRERINSTAQGKS